MALKPKTAAKLASLSAAGAGALVFGAKDAKATVIMGTPNAKVGFDSGFGVSFTSPTLGTGSAHFKFTRIHSTPGTDTRRKVVFNGTALSFRANSSGAHTLRVFASGALNTFSKSAPFNHAQGNGLVASVFGLNKTPFPSNGGLHPSFSNEFALFKFTSGANTLYGWVELSETINDRTPAPYGPDLTITEWAYSDVNGFKLAAGALTDSVAAGTPEPGTLATTGLAALALGAAGLRRWRASRKQS